MYRYKYIINNGTLVIQEKNGSSRKNGENNSFCCNNVKTYTLLHIRIFSI